MTYRLSDFGSYRAGGRIETVSGRPSETVQFTATTSYRYDPNGDFAVESAYVQYFRPAARNSAPPVVLLHGGGMSGSMWETTPDGRPGWLHGLLAAGFEVHVVDNVERGRAGWVPNLWPGRPFLRSMQEAWTLFRFGRGEDFAARLPFDGQQFPVAALETFAQGFVPRWTSTTEAQVAALGAVLERLGRALVVSHSQGSEVAFAATAKAPELVAGLVAIEPSGLPEDTRAVASVPITIVHGDYLDTDQLWINLSARWRAIVRALCEAGGDGTLLDMTRTAAGASHFPMLDAAAQDYLDVVLNIPWLSALAANDGMSHS